jgi:hypothetical protein
MSDFAQNRSSISMGRKHMIVDKDYYRGMKEKNTVERKSLKT